MLLKGFWLWTMKRELDLVFSLDVHTTCMSCMSCMSCVPYSCLRWGNQQVGPLSSVLQLVSFAMLRTGGLSAAWARLSAPLRVGVITNGPVSGAAAVSYQFAFLCFQFNLLLEPKKVYLTSGFIESKHSILIWGKLSAIFQPCCTKCNTQCMKDEAAMTQCYAKYPR